MEPSKMIVIAKCPHCHRSILYSDNVRDKSTIRVFPVDDSYKGKKQICSKCKKMFAIVEKPPHYVVLPIMESAENLIN